MQLFGTTSIKITLINGKMTVHTLLQDSIKVLLIVTAPIEWKPNLLQSPGPLWSQTCADNAVTGKNDFQAGQESGNVISDRYYRYAPGFQRQMMMNGNSCIVPRLCRLRLYREIQDYQRLPSMLTRPGDHSVHLHGMHSTTRRWSHRNSRPFPSHHDRTGNRRFLEPL